MRAPLAAASALLIHAVAGGIGYENELQFHAFPDTYNDLTASHLALGAPVETHGNVVGSVSAYDPEAGATLTIDGEKEGLKDGDWVTVQLEYPPAVGMSPSALKTVWVGLFGPSGTNISTTTPIKYTLPTADPSFASTGKATLRFRIINMRVPLDVAFLTDCKIPPYYMPYRGVKDCTVLLRVMGVSMADYDEPARPALLRDQSSTTIRLAWTTATLVQGARVEFWPVGQQGAARTAWPVSKQPYTTSDLCDAPAKTYGYFPPGIRHVATMHTMAPGVTYAYSIKDDSGRATEPVQFKMPAAPSGSATARLFVYADLGRGTEDGALTWEDYGRPALNTSKYMKQELDAGIGGEDGIFHVGDISYAVGFLPIWDTYGDMMADVIGRTAYSLNFGNHEADNIPATTPSSRTVTLYNGSDAGGECGVACNGWYPMPWRSIDEPWYSYDVGPVHVVAMSTEHDYRTHSAQWEWLRADLAAVDRSVTPWILVGGHRPMYIDSVYSGPWDSDMTVSDTLVKHVEPLLDEYGVDIAVWGHNHVVQRFCMLRRHECVEHSSGPTNRYTKGKGGTVHLVIGAAGAAFTKNIHHPHLEMTEFAAYVYGHSRMVFHGSDRMTWEWISNINGSVLDHMEIVTPAQPDQGLSDGAVVGIVAGSAIVAGALAAVVWNGIRHWRTTARAADEPEPTDETVGVTRVAHHSTSPGGYRSIEATSLHV